MLLQPIKARVIWKLYSALTRDHDLVPMRAGGLYWRILTEVKMLPYRLTCDQSYARAGANIRDLTQNTTAAATDENGIRQNILFCKRMAVHVRYNFSGTFLCRPLENNNVK